jgi:uroporphyrinogen decarboxylase
MKPVDNLRTLLDGGSPLWIPFSLDVGALPGLSAPIERTFRQVTGADDPAAHFDTDIRCFSLPTRAGADDPASLHESLPPGATFDEWAVGHWSGGAEGTADRHYSPLARAESVGEVEALPSPWIDVDTDTSPVQAYHAAGYPVFGYGGSIYEWSWWLRGMQNFLMDLLSNRELAEAVLAKVEDHTTRLAVASARAGIDVLCFYDDAGMQQGLQISPGLWRRFIKPAWQRVLESVRSQRAGVKFFLHCCGKIDLIVPDIIELGFHVLHPVQPECMDFEALYRLYGRDIVLAATISSQKLFPFGSAKAVRREVRRLATVVREDRRAILMPSNVIQPETPWENVVAFAQEARALRQAP